MTRFVAFSHFLAFDRLRYVYQALLPTGSNIFISACSSGLPEIHANVSTCCDLSVRAAAQHASIEVVYKSHHAHAMMLFIKDSMANTQAWDLFYYHMHYAAHAVPYAFIYMLLYDDDLSLHIVIFDSSSFGTWACSKPLDQNDNQQ